MFTKNLIFLMMMSAVSNLVALPISLVKNRASKSILINTIALKSQSVARIKKLEIPFTTWLKFREAIVDGKEYCPENTLKITVGSKKWSLWVNELGIWAVVIDESMPLSPSDQKPLLLVSFARDKNPVTISCLFISDQLIEFQL